MSRLTTTCVRAQDLFTFGKFETKLPQNAILKTLFCKNYRFVVGTRAWLKSVPVFHYKIRSFYVESEPARTPPNVMTFPKIYLGTI